MLTTSTLYPRNLDYKIIDIKINTLLEGKGNKFLIGIKKNSVFIWKIKVDRRIV